MKKYESPEMKIVEVDEKILTTEEGGNLTTNGDIDGSGGTLEGGGIPF